MPLPSTMQKSGDTIPFSRKRRNIHEKGICTIKTLDCIQKGPKLPTICHTCQRESRNQYSHRIPMVGLVHFCKKCYVEYKK